MPARSRSAGLDVDSHSLLQPLTDSHGTRQRCQPLAPNPPAASLSGTCLDAAPAGL